MNRRTFLNVCCSVMWVGLGMARPTRQSRAASSSSGTNLLTVPLDVGDAWNGAARTDAAAVISRMREACLSGIRLVSDRQPERLRVDAQTSGPPHIWLHADNPTTASIVVDVGTRAWSQLAYQFGHELGHVMCNSLMWKVETPPPSRWLEECLAEAFAIRGLAHLADGWERNPPFPNDYRYAQSLRDYRRDLVEKYRQAAGPEDTQHMAAWLRDNRKRLDETTGLGVYAGPAILTITTAMENDKGCVEDLGAVNRWSQRSGVPLEDYLRLWRESCAQVGGPGRLPRRLQDVFGLNAARSP
jgi:hypothetical protein